MLMKVVVAAAAAARVDGCSDNGIVSTLLSSRRLVFSVLHAYIQM
jgi:hypothetical protein